MCFKKHCVLENRKSSRKIQNILKYAGLMWIKKRLLHVIQRIYPGFQSYFHSNNI